MYALQFFENSGVVGGMLFTKSKQKFVYKIFHTKFKVFIKIIMKIIFIDEWLFPAQYPLDVVAYGCQRSSSPKAFCLQNFCIFRNVE